MCAWRPVARQRCSLLENCVSLEKRSLGASISWHARSTPVCGGISGHVGGTPVCGGNSLDAFLGMLGAMCQCGSTPVRTGEVLARYWRGTGE
eukprot:1011111-Alexandrium_andersonii.AAC.1